MTVSANDGVPVESRARSQIVATRVSLGAAVLALGWVGLHRVAESDVFWHLHQGRAVLRHMARVVPEPTAFPELARETRVAAWLWDVIAYLVQNAFGFAGLGWLTAACAMLAGAAVIWMLRGTRPAAPPAALVLVAGVALACMTSRARARPEIAALLMLPLLIGALQRFARDPRAGMRYFVMAVVAALLWAQLHGSFLLVLPIAAVVLGAALLERWRQPRARAALLALGLALLVASLTSTSGLDLLSFGAEHAAADIKRHNAEMHAPLWQTFNPAGSVFGPLYLLTAALGLYGAVHARRAALAQIGLALLGALVVMQSVRFLAMATVLSAPLALLGASDLVQRVRGRAGPALVLAASCLAAALIFYRVVDRAQSTIGPLGRLGLAEHALPLAGIHYLLQHAPAGTRVLTAYDAGGSVGFFLDGRVRTFVDSRTMVLFDDVQFALARDVFHSRAALDRAARRYRAQVVMVPRHDKLCAQLAVDGIAPALRGGVMAAPWVPVAIDPQWTMFTTRPDAPALQAVAPCGGDYVLPAACNAGGAALAGDVRRLRALHTGPLPDFLAAVRRGFCARDFAGATRLLPTRADAEGFVQSRDLAAGEFDLALHAGKGVLAEVGAWAAQGDPAAWDLVMRALPLGKVDGAALLPIARSAVDALDDQTPPRVRELLALLCIEAGDASCVRFHGLRAALAGSPNAATLLRWLATKHPDPAVRADAAAWQAALAHEGRASSDGIAPALRGGATSVPAD